MISRTHCLVYEQRWGPHCAHVWHWTAFFVCCVFTSRCSAIYLMRLLWASSRARVCATFTSHLPATQVECFHGAFFSSFCSDDLSEKSRIILYGVIWSLRCGALIFGVKLKKVGFRHMESESLFRVTVKESSVAINFSSWSEGERFCGGTKKLH